MRLPCCQHFAWGDCYIISTPPKGSVSMLPQFTEGETEAPRSHSHKVMHLENKCAKLHTHISLAPEH